MTLETARDCAIHIADLHFWKVCLNPLRLLNKRCLGNLNVALRRRHAFPMARAAQYLPAVEATGARYAICTGDFTSTSLDAEFVRASAFVDALHASNIDITGMPGNHDVYTFAAMRANRFEHFLRGIVPPRKYPSLVHLPGGTPLVLVPTVCPNLLSSKGRIADTEIALTAELLVGCEGPVLVAGHYPLLAQTRHYTLTSSRRLRNADALRGVLGASEKQILYLCGHVHRCSYTQDPTYPTLRHLTTGTFFGDNPAQDRNGEFSEIQVYENRVEVYNHAHKSEWGRTRLEPEPLR